MNLLFVHFHHFGSNSAIHIANLANRLTRYGINCAVAVPWNEASIRELEDPKFIACGFAELNAGAKPFANGKGPDLIHAWTPREIVRRETESLARLYDCPYVVHLEDNEEVIFEASTGISRARIPLLSLAELDERATENLAHPVRYRRFLEGAGGVTVIIDTLFAFKPAEIPGEEIGAGYDDRLFHPRSAPDLALRRKLHIPDGDYIVTYTGNVHPANAAEMRSLYLAVGLANRLGHSVKLVRTGENFCDFLDKDLQFLDQYVIDLGSVPRSELASYLALADFLVQPGRAGEWNDFRLPSKLPEFLAMGRPVVLPNSNIGRRMRHQTDAMVMQEGHSLDIARQMSRLIGDPELRQRLSLAGPAFAEEHLNWNRSARKLLGFYERVLQRPLQERSWHRRSRPPAAAGDAVLPPEYARYTEYPVPMLGYATVGDYVDSLEHLPDLAQISQDLKDVQRPWMLKAIVSRLPPGAKLLEIGGGDPWVASRLAELGYQVVVVDPYEGAHFGPSDFAHIEQNYPQLTFVRGFFPEAMPADMVASFDAIFSISVLEHVPMEKIGEVFKGIRCHLRDENCPTIHAVDHVYKGSGDQYHLTKVQQIVDSAGLSRSLLDHVLARAKDDPEVYFLSAEAHNRWRREIPYPDFPMRRVISLQICTPALQH